MTWSQIRALNENQLVSKKRVNNDFTKNDLCVSSYKICCRWSCCSLMLVIPCTNIEERIKVSNISACISFYQSALLQLKINKCAYRIKVSLRFKNPVEYPVGNMLIPVINQSKYLNY